MGGGFGAVARSLGQFGSDAGTAHDIGLDWRAREQQLRLNAIRSQLEQLMLPLQIKEIQEKLRQYSLPQYRGTEKLPGGGIGVLESDPKSGQTGLRTVAPGVDKNAAKQQILKMAEGVSGKEEKATLQSYANSIDAGEDPQQALQKALAFMGSSATHQQVTGRVRPGAYVPDSSSATGISREQVDGLGNRVGLTRNVIMPGMVPKTVEGWEKTTDEDGNEILVPKTTVTTPQVPGGGKTPTQGGPRVIGHKNTPVQSDAVKASKDARDAAILKKDVDDNIEAAKKGNARASLALVFAAVRMMVQGAGRMTQVEVQQEAQAGSYGQRIQRWVEMAASGTLPVDQMEQIREIVQNGYESKRAGGQEAWEYAYPNRPLPPWLRPSQQRQQKGDAPPPPPPGATLEQH